MGYIAPSTTITFYRDTGLSPNYDNTLYFTTEADKNSYFRGQTEIMLELILT